METGGNNINSELINNGTNYKYDNFGLVMAETIEDLLYDKYISEMIKKTMKIENFNKNDSLAIKEKLNKLNNKLKINNNMNFNYLANCFTNNNKGLMKIRKLELNKKGIKSNTINDYIYRKKIWHHFYKLLMHSIIRLNL